MLTIRIDDRLIHGQVVIGWGSHLGLKRLVVANDEIADNEWENELMRMAAPPDVEAQVLTLADTVRQLAVWQENPEPTMVLLNSFEDLLRLARLGLSPLDVNVGGVHFQEGREEILSYLYINPEERKQVMELAEMGFKLTCQDVPGSPCHSLRKILEKSS